MPRTPLHAPPLSGACLAAVLAVVACVPKDPYDPGAATAAPDGDSTGAPGSTSDTPDDPTAPTTGNLPDGSTSDAAPTTGEPGTSDSGDSTGEPPKSECPYAPPGVAVTLARATQGVPEDLTSRPCGTTDGFTSFVVVETAPGALELAACADATCGDCDESDLLTLGLTIPAPFNGLPPDPAPGDCVQLSATWSRPTDDPAQCTISALALVRVGGGLPDPVPRFLYHHSETLPATDTVGPFALTGAPAGLGDQLCPCEAECCDQPPGARRVEFTAKLGMSEIGIPPIHPGDTVEAFALGTPEGDDLLGKLSLVRAFALGDCDTSSQYEWILRVTP